MPIVLTPKYSIDRIRKNFFSRTQTESIAQFVSGNFEPFTQTNERNIPPNSNIDYSLINSILTDYGNGPISIGLMSLTVINTNVLTGQQLSSDIFNNYLLYGQTIEFHSTTKEQARDIILRNLQMKDISNNVSVDLRESYCKLIDNIAVQLKSGGYDPKRFSKSVLRESKILANAVSSRSYYGSNI